MKKTLTILVAVLLCVALVFSVVGCQSTVADQTATEETASTEKTAAAETAAAEETAAADTAAEGTKTLAFIPPNMITPYYAMIIEGAKPTAEALGYELIVQSPSAADAYEEQVSIIENMVTTGVAAIAICTHDASSITSAVQKANDAGIPVVIFNTLQDLPGDVDVYAYTGYDPWQGGILSADYIAEKLGEKGQIAVLDGIAGANTEERKAGFIDEIAKYPDIEIVATQNADWARDTAYDVATNILQANPDVKAFFACSDEMAIGAAQAAKALGIEGIVTIGIDGNTATFESIKAGETTASLDTDPYNIGVSAITLLDQAIKDPTPLTENKIIVDCFIVDSSNIDEYLK